MSEPARPSIEAVATALAASWGRETAAQPEQWSDARPATTQCDASSFVAWEMLGGDLVLARVLVDGVQTQFHYWNRVDGRDIDFTASQFDGHEDIVEVEVVTDDRLRAQSATMRDELRNRIALLRSRVHAVISQPGC